jgi:hypothetical protein
MPRQGPPGGGPGSPLGSGGGDVHVRAGKRERKVNYPKAFDGKPKNLRKFLQDTQLYLHINREVYDDDEAKIAFVLSLLEGTATTWKEQYLDNNVDAFGDYDFPMYDAFIGELERDFRDVDAKADALYQLNTIEQGNTPIETHNAKFKLLVSQSGLDRLLNRTVLVNNYQKSINVEILTECWKQMPTPTSLDDWMSAAQTVDTRN